MGLDIYFKKVKTQGAETTNIENLELMRRDYRRTLLSNGVFAEINTILKTNLNEETKKRVIELIEPYIYYNFERTRLIESRLERLEECVNDILESFVSREDMYYRKVNCLYAYFNDRLEDEQCLVTKADVEDIIDRAKNVLLAHDEETSAQLLPTQSGFFFGSTEYDEYYYDDIADVYKLFTKYLEDWTDDTIGWVYFSW